MTTENKVTNDIGNQENELSYETVSETANYLLSRTKHRPKIAIICGSGLDIDLNPSAGLAELLTNPDVFPYTEIPNFPVSTVKGHKSRLLFGHLNGIPVMLMQGRFHLYEGYAMGKCAMPVRVMKLCGVENLIVTNAAGGLNPTYKVGDIMLLKDHINLPGFTGMHPLKGPNESRFGDRFFALNDCYDKKLRQLAKNVAENLKMKKSVHEGVYTMLGGPNYETVAELKMLRICGVDAVGMSTIPEVLVARHCKINVFAFSLITNECILEEESEISAIHDEVIETANSCQEELGSFVSEIVKGIENMNKED